MNKHSSLKFTESDVYAIRLQPVQLYDIIKAHFSGNKRYLHTRYSDKESRMNAIADFDGVTSSPDAQIEIILGSDRQNGKCRDYNQYSDEIQKHNMYFAHVLGLEGKTQKTTLNQVLENLPTQFVEHFMLAYAPLLFDYSKN